MADTTFDRSTTLGTSGLATGTAGSKSLIESDRVEGTAVYGTDREHIGSIKRLMIDKQSGQVAYAVMSFGGFLGLGEDTHTIPWGSLHYDTDLGGYKTNISEQQLRGAPDYARGDNTDWSDRGRERALHDYYGVSPYWGL